MASEPSSNIFERFGPNEWLVNEIYEQFRRDKRSVDEAWWDFFDDYSPADYAPAAAPAGQPGASTVALAATEAPATDVTSPDVASNDSQVHVPSDGNANGSVVPAPSPGDGSPPPSLPTSKSKTLETDRESLSRVLRGAQIGRAHV